MTRVLVTGASGFIAAQIVTDLLHQNYEVTCCVRNVTQTKRLFPQCSTLACDFTRDIKIETWLPRLDNIDVVVNCVGIMHHPNPKVIWSVHVDTPKALFDACVQKGVKKIIQISALGIEELEVPYANSKKAGDQYLLNLPIEAVVLRPSLVYGRGSYGGTSLFRGLAGLPKFILLPGEGQQQFQPIHIEDLSKAVLHFIESKTETKKVFHAVGPERVNLKSILIKMRSWLGFAKAASIKVPIQLIRAVAGVGQFIPYSTINVNSLSLLTQNNITSDDEAKLFHQQIEFMPRDFSTGLLSYPSTVQDHWHARLFFLKPLLQGSLAFLWIFTAICTLWLYPKTASYQLLSQVGISASWQPFVLKAAGILDGILGVALLIGYRVKKVCQLQSILIVIYSALILFFLPQLWLDPFAPVAKNIPILAATFMLIALESDR